MIEALLLISFFSVVFEVFPISSSTHIAVLTKILEKFGFMPLGADVLKAFDFLLHAPMVVVIIVFFFNRWRLLPYYFHCHPSVFINYLVCGIIAEAITLLFFLLFAQSGFDWWPLWVGFLVTALALLSERFVSAQKESVAWNKKNAFALGFAQGIAFLPGVSRFGLTFSMARWLGFSLRHAFELSFLIEFPISCAATLKGIYDLYKLNALNLLNWQWQLTMVVATALALIFLNLVYQAIIKRAWWLFGWYAAIIALITFFY